MIDPLGASPGVMLPGDVGQVLPVGVMVSRHASRIDVSCLRCVVTISVKSLHDHKYSEFCQNHSHKETA